MTITFKDSKRMRKWNYTGLKTLDVFHNKIFIVGVDELTHERYEQAYSIDDFDSIELEKSEGEA